MNIERSTIPKPADEAEWLAARRPYFNASSAAVLYNRHPFQTAGDYATEKLTGKGQARNRAMERGHRMEDMVATWWASEQGWNHLDTPTVMYRAGSMLATVDRVVFGDEDEPLFPVEIKTTTMQMSEPSQYWLDQCQAIMWCCGADEIALVWLDGSLDYQWQMVTADAEFQQDMARRADEFMAAIEFGIVPDWVRMSAGNIADLYVETTEDPAELDDDVAVMVQAFADKKAAVKALESELSELKDEIAAALNDHEVGVYDGAPIVTWKRGKPRKQFDKDAFAAEYPDLVEKFTVEVPGARTFLPKLKAVEA